MVSGHHRVPSAISPVIRGRGTAQSGTFGAVILDVRMGSLADTTDRRPWIDAWADIDNLPAITGTITP